MIKKSPVKYLREMFACSLIWGSTAQITAQVVYSTPSYTISTLAGVAGITGFADGNGSAAKFSFPATVAVDGSGVLYVADTFNHIIRKVTPAGAVTTLAGTLPVSGGNSNIGFTDGTGNAAQFDTPGGIAVDGSGNIYVADTLNSSIRKITSAGVVTTFAGPIPAAGSSTGGSTSGSGITGSTDGTGSAARFAGPEGIVADSSGNLYIADSGNSTIRKITPEAVVTTIAGTAGNRGTADGMGGSAQFNGPTGIALDNAGNIFIADTGNNLIRKLAPSGMVTTIAGSSGTTSGGFADGTGSAALFSSPNGIAVDSSDNLYVADLGNSIIRKITSGDIVTTLAGKPQVIGGTDGEGNAATFDKPAGVAVDSSGNVYIADTSNGTIRKGVPAAGNASGPPSFVTQPRSAAVPGGTVALYAAASNSPTYQWMLNGVPVAGATKATLVLTNAAGAAGSYTVLASNSAGQATSEAAVVSIVQTNDVGRLVNISCRATVGTGANILIAGFVVGGSGTTGSESLLIRGSGPALVPFGVTGILPDPQLQIFAGANFLGSNDGWEDSAQVSSTAAKVGAFGWTNPSSHDAALLETLSDGAYTAQIAGEGGDGGVALAEIYDATSAGTYTATSPRIVNISARVEVGIGGNILIAGFAIGGTTSRTVLIRASGPALVPFGVSGVLADPELRLYSGSTVLESNTGWEGDSQIASTAASVGAFTWNNGSSNDSAILVTLSPGPYTAQVSGAGGDTGIALVEIYEVP